MGILETILNGKGLEEGSVLSNLRHVLLQDGKYVPLAERPKVEEPPFRIMSQQGLFGLIRSPESSFSIKEIVESLGMAFMSGEIGFGDDAPQYVELIVDDRNLPKNIEADVVIAISADPIHVDNLNCGALVVHCPEFFAKNIEVDNYVAIATERLQSDHMKALCGTIVATEYNVRDAEIRNVRIITNNLADGIVGDNSLVVNMSDLSQKDKIDIFEGLKAIGDATSILIGTNAVELSDDERNSLYEVIGTIDRRDQNYRFQARAKNRTSELDNDFQMFGNPRRRGCRRDHQGTRGNGRPQGQTQQKNLQDARFDRLADMFERFMASQMGGQNQTAPQGAPQATPTGNQQTPGNQQQAAPQQGPRRRRVNPNPQGSGTNTTMTLTDEEVQVLESLADDVLNSIMAPLAVLGIQAATLARDAKLQMLKAAAALNQQVVHLLRQALQPHVQAARNAASQQQNTGTQTNCNTVPGAGPIPNGPTVPGSAGNGARP